MKFKAAAILEICGRSERGRQILREMPGKERENLYALAADEWDRRAREDVTG